tara:strand:- start:389 stop:625 length:237 start_codon:yes stop_codon:yes gene_type:complete
VPNRPTPEEIFEKSQELLLLCKTPGFVNFCNDIWFLANDDNPEPTKFFNQIRRNYPGWQKDDFAALYFTLRGENPNEK